MQVYKPWKFKYELIIENSPITDDYPVKIDLYKKPGMRYDFRDIRFATATGEKLYFDIDVLYYEIFPQNYTHCIVFVKVPKDTPHIYIYYGNGQVADGSDPANTYNAYYPCDLTDGGWTQVSGKTVKTNGMFDVYSPSTTSVVSSIANYPPETLVEIRACHSCGNASILGFRNSSTLKHVTWLGASKCGNPDHMYTQDTSSSDEDDHVARGGSTFYTYGIHYLSGGIAKFYVDHVLRATFTTNVPSVSLPIQLCSATGKHLYVNWVRVRTVQAVEPTVTVGTKYIIEDPYYDSVEYEFDTVATQSNVTESIKDMMADSLITKVLNGFAIGAPIKVTDSVTTESTVSETDPITRDELSDCNLKSCDISKSITDAYMQLSASFADNKVQTENSTVKYYALDSLSVKHLLFWGKVITRSPTEASYYSTVEINAADDSRNLSVQKVPFNDLVISLTGKYDRWSEWIEYLLATEKTGVAAGTIIDRGTPDKQFVFDLKTTRWEAIKKICDYCGLVYNVKLVASGDVYVPTFYALPAADIDQPGGFNLPAPLTFENPADATIVDQPTLQGDPEENYNTVTVVGTITSTGETVIASVWTPAVESGEQKPREYVVTDNSIEEKESTAEIEAIRWLLYLSAPKATLSMKLIKRFDLELFQRIKFGSGFPATIKELTDSVQLPYVVTCDPRAESSTKHHVDVSGVPMSAWFRISEMKYHTEDLQDTCEIKLVTDFIYSTVDPYIEDPYSVYLPPGYFKPVSSDSTGSTQAIVDSTIEKKLSPELSTLISIDEDGQTGNVETESGKIVVLKKLPSGAVCGDEILIIPDGKGNYYGVSPG